MANRRQFVAASASFAAGTLMWGAWSPAWAVSTSPRLPKFIAPLREVGAANGIPMAASDGVRQWPGGSVAQHYSIRMEQFEDQLHPSLPNETRIWGYHASNMSSSGRRHLGSVIVAQRGTPIQITATNLLPADHILPVDATIPGAPQPGQAANRASIHLHGGHVPWISDGTPHAWFDPAGGYGASVVNASTGQNLFKVVNSQLSAGQAEYFYPNIQGARLMWYHDHALGTTRLNAYAGLASAYVITDSYESLTMSVGYNVPGPLDPRTKYLVFQDKSFVSAATASLDPTWSSVVSDTREGDFWYEHVATQVASKSLAALPLPDPSCVPEFFGDTILVNGTVAPYLVLGPRQYRLRLLNACNSRFLNPRLVYARGTKGVDATEPQPNAPGPAFIQIGNEGGFLPAPVMVNGPRQLQLLLAPAERADVIVDLRSVRPGSVLILYNDAPAPYPGGMADNDHYPGNNKTPASTPGSTPNTRTLLQVRVVPRSGGADAAISLPAGNMQNPYDAPFLVTQQPGVPTAIPPGIPVRRVTLNEGIDAHGRLIQELGTDVPVLPATAAGTFARSYEDDPTETPNSGSVEAWEMINLSADSHPIHFHLVNVQVLSRRPFNMPAYAGGEPRWTSVAQAPDDNELGWKETVRVPPGAATTVIMRFGLPSGVPFGVPPSPRTGGAEYVWHCHILEHEEHDMMRPLIVN